MFERAEPITQPHNAFQPYTEIRAMADDGTSDGPRTVVYNGVAVPTVDPEVEQDYWPEREAATSDALRHRVRRGDDVVVVGGGRGITTVVAARMTHFEGTVTAYEANSELLETLRRTLEVNRVASLVTLEHVAVGPVSERSADVFGPADGDRLDPADLPACDVLELDCEGAELPILREMVIRPRTIVVETHDPHGVPSADVCDVLEAKEYHIADRNPAGMDDELEVLTAVRDAG